MQGPRTYVPSDVHEVRYTCRQMYVPEFFVVSITYGLSRRIMETRAAEIGCLMGGNTAVTAFTADTYSQNVKEQLICQILLW